MFDRRLWLGMGFLAAVVAFVPQPAQAQPGLIARFAGTYEAKRLGRSIEPGWPDEFTTLVLAPHGIAHLITEWPKPNKPVDDSNFRMQQENGTWSAGESNVQVHLTSVRSIGLVPGFNVPEEIVLSFSLHKCTLKFEHQSRKRLGLRGLTMTKRDC